jgi:drug/metabolite transporter (DMT)-like permease
LSNYYNSIKLIRPFLFQLTYILLLRRDILLKRGVGSREWGEEGMGKEGIILVVLPDLKDTLLALLFIVLCFLISLFPYFPTPPSPYSPLPTP